MAYRVYSRASIEHRQSLLATFVLISMLALVLGIERFIQDRDAYAAMVVLEYAVCVALLIAILSFSLCYTGQRSFVSRRFISIITGIGAAVVAVNATNGLHHLFYVSFEIIENEGLHMMQPEYGPLFFVWLIYAVGILAFVMGWLLKAAGSMMGSKRQGTVLIVLGLGFYTFMGILNSVLPRDPRVDMLTIGLLGAAIMVYAANRTSSIIEQHGMTMEEALRDMDDGVVIEDPEHRVMYMNDTARELRIMDRSPYLGAIPAEGSVDVRLGTRDGEREFNVKRSMVDRNGASVGTVTVMRDVTESRTTEKRLALANHRLDTMARALRHDIMNELTVLHGHLALLSGTELE
jgi:PAS domain-containing protein